MAVWRKTRSKKRTKIHDWSDRFLFLVPVQFYSASLVACVAIHAIFFHEHYGSTFIVSRGCTIVCCTPLESGRGLDTETLSQGPSDIKMIYVDRHLQSMSAVMISYHPRKWTLKVERRASEPWRTLTLYRVLRLQRGQQAFVNTTNTTITISTSRFS